MNHFVARMLVGPSLREASWQKLKLDFLELQIQTGGHFPSTLQLSCTPLALYYALQIHGMFPLLTLIAIEHLSFLFLF
jgi:hypothetical protein